MSQSAEQILNELIETEGLSLDQALAAIKVASVTGATLPDRVTDLEALQASPVVVVYADGTKSAYTTRDLAVTAANAATGGGLVVCSWGVSTAGSVVPDADVTVVSMDSIAGSSVDAIVWPGADINTVIINAIRPYITGYRAIGISAGETIPANGATFTVTASGHAEDDPIVSTFEWRTSGDATEGNIKLDISGAGSVGACLTILRNVIAANAETTGVDWASGQDGFQWFLYPCFGYTVLDVDFDDGLLSAMTAEEPSLHNPSRYAVDPDMPKQRVVVLGSHGESYVALYPGVRLIGGAGAALLGAIEVTDDTEVRNFESIVAGDFIEDNAGGIAIYVWQHMPITNGYIIDNNKISSSFWCVRGGAYIAGIGVRGFATITNNVLSAPNPIWDEAIGHDAVITNNVWDYDGAEGLCFSLLDAIDSHNYRVVVANNVGTPRVADLTSDGDAYFVRIGGWGHSITGNNIRQTITTSSASNSKAIIYLLDTSALPTGETTFAPTIVSGNMLVMDVQAGTAPSAIRCIVMSTTSNARWSDVAAHGNLILCNTPSPVTPTRIAAGANTNEYHATVTLYTGALDGTFSAADDALGSGGTASNVTVV